MKYCKKCGMLLEDAIENCIKCGTDVTDPANISYFPPEIRGTMEEQRANSKNNTKTVILIICILIVLVGLVAGAAIAMSNGQFMIGPEDVLGDLIQTEETVAEDEEIAADEVSEAGSEEVIEERNDVANVGISDEATQTEEAEEEPAPRVVKDTKGSYLRYVTEVDAAENKVFNAVYPEDFTDANFSITYNLFSNRFPMQINFSAEGEDGAVHFAYMSPRQFWQKQSKTAQSFSNNLREDVYMTYYEYTGAQGYVETIIKESYGNVKIKLVSEEEYSPEATEAVKAFAEAENKLLAKRMKHSDYAYIGEDTEYEVQEEYEYSANVYEYVITTSEKKDLYLKFYVPVVANKANYYSEKYSDKGVITEWYCLAFVVMEAGNDEIYDDYRDDFNIFIDNCVPTDTFMKINQLYCDEIDDYISENETVKEVTRKELEEYGAEEEFEMYEFYALTQNALRSVAGSYFEADDLGLYFSKDAKVAFLSADNGKIYVSEAADEYPGEQYADMELRAIPKNEGIEEPKDEGLGDEDEKSGKKANDL